MNNIICRLDEECTELVSHYMETRLKNKYEYKRMRLGTEFALLLLLLLLSRL